MKRFILTMLLAIPSFASAQHPSYSETVTLWQDDCLSVQAVKLGDDIWQLRLNTFDSDVELYDGIRVMNLDSGGYLLAAAADPFQFIAWNYPDEVAIAGFSPVFIPHLSEIYLEIYVIGITPEPDFFEISLFYDEL